MIFKWLSFTHQFILETEIYMKWKWLISYEAPAGNTRLQKYLFIIAGFESLGITWVRDAWLIHFFQLFFFTRAWYEKTVKNAFIFSPKKNRRNLNYDFGPSNRLVWKTIEGQWPSRGGGIGSRGANGRWEGRGLSGHTVISKWDSRIRRADVVDSVRPLHLHGCTKLNFQLT